MDTNKSEKAADPKIEESKAAADKNKENQVTEASQKGKAVDRDITDPATAPEE